MSNVASHELLPLGPRTMRVLAWLGRWAVRHAWAFKRVGECLGGLLLRFGIERREIARRNLQLCFPHMSEAEREAILRQHFRLLGRALIDRVWLWHADTEQIQSLVRWEEASRLRLSALASEPQPSPLLIMCPHTLGMEPIWSALCQALPEGAMVGYYRPPQQAWLDRWFYFARQRWGAPLALRRQDGMRGMLRSMREGRHGYLLPDQDLGRSGCEFVPFFGIAASTVTTMPRLAANTGARLCWIIGSINDNAPGYALRLSDPLPGIPSDDMLADLQRINQDIEREVRARPAQYYWTHRRFKTRPQDEPSLYA